MEPHGEGNAQDNNKSRACSGSGLSSGSRSTSSELHIPRRSVTNIMREALPIGANISKDSKDAMQQCVTEFITYVTREAKHICHQQNRLMINAQDITAALNNLGFSHYVQHHISDSHNVVDSMAPPPPPPAPSTLPETDVLESMPSIEIDMSFVDSILHDLDDQLPAPAPSAPPVLLPTPPRARAELASVPGIEDALSFVDSILRDSDDPQ